MTAAEKVDTVRVLATFGYWGATNRRYDTLFSRIMDACNGVK